MQPWLADRTFIDEGLADQLPLGVIVLDQHGQVVLFNRCEERLSRRVRSQVIGRHFFEDVARCTNVQGVRGVFEARIASNPLDVDIPFAFPLAFLPAPRRVMLRFRFFEADGQPWANLFIEDLPERAPVDFRQRLSLLIHDLANPLVGVLGCAEMARADTIDPADLHDLLSSVEQGARQMVAVLDAAGKELSGGVNEPQAVNVHALLLAALGLQLPAARQRDVALHYEGLLDGPRFPKRTVTVHGSVDQLASAIDNMLSNAVKYARTTVHAQLTTADGEVVIDVTDDGPGVAEAMRHRVFDEGFQAPGSLPGNGLGLFSARTAARAHAGDITLECVPGRTTVRMTLPLP